MNLRFLPLLLILTGLAGLVNAQDDRAYLGETNQQALDTLSQQFRQAEKKELARARQIAREANIPLRQVLPDGTVIEVAGVGPGGLLEFHTTHNLDAAKTTQTDRLWPGSGRGWTLTGKGYTIGEWDGGKVYAKHQDLTGRVTQQDNATSISDHATHVAGTLMSSDSVNQARGMAFKSDLDAYDWNNDDSEMASAASSGLLISNHSYGTLTGWRYKKSESEWYWYGNTNISQKEDYRFGFYTRSARNWDQIARKAPFYLIVKSAGNDRNDDGPDSNNQHKVRDNNNNWVKSTKQRTPDGSYDCIGSKGNAKNILTIGAVNDLTSGYSGPADVSMTSFSSWGPTDDGRIKPDLVANGRSVKSCGTDNTTDYERKSGTSMAAPNAAGSMLLLQEHYKDTRNQQMRAATLKGLVIHTANEAGPADGPDYKHGWGLLNATRTARHITNNSGGDFMLEQSLANNDTFTFTVNATAQDSLSATLCWHDPAGTPPSPQLDPTTKMLENDLDLRIRKKQGNAIHKPYVMDPANPAKAATTGDNVRDNVEQVAVASPQSGSYVVQVTHKGSLQDAPQHFSLMISATGKGCQAPAGLTVDSFKSDQATLSWTSFSKACPNQAKNWKLQWGQPGFTIGQGDSTTVSQTTGTILGLFSNTPYEAYVAEVRAGGKQTSYVGPVSFRTTLEPAQLPYQEDFERFIGTYIESAIIPGPNRALWTFQSSEPEGRLRFSGPEVDASSGTHSATLDVNQDQNLAANDLILTLNMQNYSTSEPLLLRFDHREYGEENHANDSVWVRGSRSENWVGIYDLNANSTASFQQAGPINLSRALKQAGQSYSPSFQVRFGQEDNYTLGGRLNDGRSFDNISLNQQDLALDRILKPTDYCGLTARETLKVVVKNDGYSTIDPSETVQAFFQVNQQSPQLETVTLQQPLKPDDTVHHTFQQSVDLAQGGGPYNLLVGVQYAPDRQVPNDTLKKQIEPRNAPLADFKVGQSCTRQPTVFTQQVDAKGGTVQTYRWSLGDGAQSRKANPQHIYSNAGQFQVQLEVVTQNQCKAVDSQLITVHPTPDAAFEANSLCGLDSVALVDESRLNGSMAQAYSWQWGDGGQSTGKQVHHAYTKGGQYVVQHTVASQQGCVDTQRQTVPVAAQPRVAYSIADTLCAGELVPTTNSTTPSDTSVVNYTWQTPANGPITDLKEPLLTFPEGGSYDLTLLATARTDTLQCQDKVTKSLQVDEVIPAGFRKVSDQAGQVTLAPNRENAEQYRWQLRNGQTSNQLKPTVSYDSNGTYTITLITTSAAGCRDTATQSVAVETVGLANQQRGTGFEVYPNPVRPGQVVHLRRRLSQNSGSYSLSLISVSGKVLQSRQISTIGNQGLTMAIPDHLSSGVYLLRLSGHQTTRVKRLIITTAP